MSIVNSIPVRVIEPIDPAVLAEQLPVAKAEAERLRAEYEAASNAVIEQERRHQGDLHRGAVVAAVEAARQFRREVDAEFSAALRELGRLNKEQQRQERAAAIAESAAIREARAATRETDRKARLRQQVLGTPKPTVVERAADLVDHALGQFARLRGAS
jgi:hypothetical protein